MKGVFRRSRRPLKGEVECPPDKSISHRSAVISAVSCGRSVIDNYLLSGDPLSTLACLEKLGISILIDAAGRESCVDDWKVGADGWKAAIIGQKVGADDRRAGCVGHKGRIIVESPGLGGWKKPEQILDCGNSGTTARLLTGLLAACPWKSTLDGDMSLRSRPMNRVFEPVSLMGASVTCSDNGRLPASITGRARHSLRAINWQSPVASAQIKSCVLLAAFGADAPCSVTEPFLSRDHTEKMLDFAGVPVKRKGKGGLTVVIDGSIMPRPAHWHVPGDPSSAAFLAAAALLIPHSDITISGVCLNPVRTGFIDVLSRMGAYIQIREYSAAGDVRAPEKTGSLRITYSPLKGTVISGDEIPAIIDEIPVIALLACFAEGRTEIRDAAELRNKECDRLSVLAAALKSMGARIEERQDGMLIFGAGRLNGCELDSAGDHRMAMTFALAGLSAEGVTTVRDFECVDISFPGFVDVLERLGLESDQGLRE